MFKKRLSTNKIINNSSFSSKFEVNVSNHKEPLKLSYTAILEYWFNKLLKPLNLSVYMRRQPRSKTVMVLIKSGLIFKTARMVTNGYNGLMLNKINT